MGGETRTMRACAIFGSGWDDGWVGKMSSARSGQVVLVVVIFIAWISTRRRVVGAGCPGGGEKVVSDTNGTMLTKASCRPLPKASVSSTVSSTQTSKRLKAGSKAVGFTKT